jgi:MiaB/RimO family radical SAM methylthiotransferase
MSAGKKIFFTTTFKLCDNSGYTSTQIFNFFRCNGFLTVNKPDEADYIIINTCGFDQEREDISAGVIDEYVTRFWTSKSIIICGCMAKICQDSFDLSKVTTIGPKELFKLNDVFQPKIKIEDVSGGKLNDSFIDRDYGIIDAYYLQISQGCINNCSYCAIKQAKGYVTSKPLNRIISEIEGAMDDGYDHFMLLADDCGSYGVDLAIDFSDLLNQIADYNIEISINYIEPGRFLNLYPKINQSVFHKVKFINVPIQSTSNRIIRMMDRHYDISQIFELIKELKLKFPSVFLETHIVYGFPTETGKEFEDTFTAAGFFDSVIYFYYTDRKNVRSSRFEGKISENEINHRTELILKHPLFHLSRDTAIPPVIMLGYAIENPSDIFRCIERSHAGGRPATPIH